MLWLFKVTLKLNKSSKQQTLKPVKSIQILCTVEDHALMACMPKRVNNFWSLANFMIFLVSQNEYILTSLPGITSIKRTVNQF